MSSKDSKPKPQPTPKSKPVFGPLIQAKALFYNDVCQQLYFINVYESEIHRYDQKTDEHVYVKAGNKPLAFAIPIATIVDRFIVGSGSDIVEVAWDGKSEQVQEFKVVKSLEAGSSINCGVVSPKGSLFIGVSGKNAGGIHKYRNGQLTQLIANINTPCGMAFSIHGKSLYLVDPNTKSLDEIDYNVINEGLSNRRIFFDCKHHDINAKPFGVGIDAEGHVWLSFYDDEIVIRIDRETAQELLRVRLEACQASSICFSGSFFREMYITTGRYKMADDETDKFPKSGYFFRVTNLDFIRGLPCRAFCPDK